MYSRPSFPYTISGYPSSSPIPSRGASVSNCIRRVALRASSRYSSSRSLLHTKIPTDYGGERSRVSTWQSRILFETSIPDFENQTSNRFEVQYLSAVLSYIFLLFISFLESSTNSKFNAAGLPFACRAPCHVWWTPAFADLGSQLRSWLYLTIISSYISIHRRIQSPLENILSTFPLIVYTAVQSLCIPDRASTKNNIVVLQGFNRLPLIS